MFDCEHLWGSLLSTLPFLVLFYEIMASFVLINAL
jgi:hypothetical protein